MYKFNDVVQSCHTKYLVNRLSVLILIVMFRNSVNEYSLLIFKFVILQSDWSETLPIATASVVYINF